MFFNYDIEFNYTLYIGLPSTKFTGSCRDKNGVFTVISKTRRVSVFECYDSCKIREDCVAFRYKTSVRGVISTCNLMVNGPYTHGTGTSGYTCYIMPSKIYSY